MGELDLLLDTDVLIDLLRQFPPALKWAEENAALRIGIPVITRLELIQGARSQAEQAILIQHLGIYPVIHLETGDSQQALQWFESLHLRSGISIMDCLIAAIASRWQIPLCTFNTKHFASIPTLKALSPYSRT